MEFNFRAEATTCNDCAAPHPAVRMLIGEQTLVMPIESAKAMADRIYEAVMQAEAADINDTNWGHTLN